MMWAGTTATTQHTICGADSVWSLSKRILALRNVRQSAFARRLAQISFGYSTLASRPKKASCLFGSVRLTRSGVLLIEKSRLAMVAPITRSWCRVVGLLRFLRNLGYLTT